MLALFGFNILGALALRRFGGMNRRRLVTAAVVVGIFAAASLAAPTASTALSIYSDDITQYKRFNYAAELVGSEWVDDHENEIAQMQVPNTEVPVKPTGSGQGIINRSAIEPGTMYVYKQSAQTGGAGLRLSSGQRVGSSQYAFVTLPPDIERDSQIYANGRMTVFRRPGVGS